ncbi:hypothetical protein [Methylocaldum sp.]|uniref:hypothetical protein n=1 Tax=Methylocaldum sp. TaxID=1969727 RepID=UPI002D54B785|nr:hypothetical protein [Methylocaldum sp.]HYE37792.1 hypothetical protein [Methylocaldum sp.]
MSSNILRWFIFWIMTYFLIYGVAFWVGANGGFGPLDDHRFASTLLQGKPFGFYVMPEVGRYVPLTAQDYVVLSNVFSPSAKIFYAWNAVKTLVVGYLLLHILTSSGVSRPVSLLMLALLLLSVGFANASTRLHVGEFNQVILLLAFIICYQKAELDDRNRFLLLGAFVIAVISFFYKEPGFILILFFAIPELFRQLRMGRSHVLSLLLVAVIVATLAYGIWYYLFIFTKKIVGYYTFHTQTFKQILGEFIDNDPFIWLILAPITAVRICYISMRRSSWTLSDSLLCGALAYATVFLALRIYNTYYLLPAYAFGIPAIASYVGHQKVTIPRLWRMPLIVALCVLTINQLPIALSDYEKNKAIPINYTDLINFLDEKLKMESVSRPGRRISIILDHISAGRGIEIFWSLIQFLDLHKLGPTVYDLHASVPPDNLTIFNQHRTLAFSALHDENPHIARVGDWVLTTPFDSPSPELEVGSIYRRLFESTSESFIPRMTLVHIMEICLGTSWNDCKENLNQAIPRVGYKVYEKYREPRQIPIETLYDFQYEVRFDKVPQKWHSGELINVPIALKNTSSQPWPANGRLDSGQLVHMAYLWFDEQGQRIMLEGNRTALPEALFSGEEISLVVNIKAPKQKGKYRLVLSPVQEGVAWFWPRNKDMQVEYTEVHVE